MRNYDISKIIYNSDLSGDLRRSAIIYGERINNGIYSFHGIEKYKDLLILLIKLSNEEYQITKKDIQILKKHNIILPTTNKQNDNHNTSTISGNSFVVVSDFHGYRYPLEKIKKDYLTKYDVIYILGDATDRGEKLDGTGSIQLLIDIMKLTKEYPGRVIYLPGNHDEFLLGYIRSKHKIDSYYPYSYIANLIYNGGLATINEINSLETKDPNIYNELVSWLGSQPIQRTHRYNGKSYVLGHAIFNQKLYNINPNYTLENYFTEQKDSDIRRMASEVLWFRKFQDTYLPTEMPSSDKIMVIGHTIESKRKDKNLDLIDPKGEVIKVYCVDGGIAYNGFMLEYDGGNEVKRTTYLTYSDEKHQTQKLPEKSFIENQTKFNTHIISKILTDGKIGFFELLQGDNPKDLGAIECQTIISKCINSAIAIDERQKRSIYIKTFLFNHILQNQIKRMQEQNYSPYIAADMIDTFLYGNKDYIEAKGNDGKGNYGYITSKNYAREIVKVIGGETLIEVLYLYGCQNVKEYIQKTEKSYQNKHKR